MNYFLFKSYIVSDTNRYICSILQINAHISAEQKPNCFRSMTKNQWNKLIIRRNKVLGFFNFFLDNSVISYITVMATIA